MLLKLRTKIRLSLLVRRPVFLTEYVNCYLCVRPITKLFILIIITPTCLESKFWDTLYIISQIYRRLKVLNFYSYDSQFFYLHVSTFILRFENIISRNLSVKQCHIICHICNQKLLCIQLVINFYDRKFCWEIDDLIILPLNVHVLPITDRHYPEVSVTSFVNEVLGTWYFFTKIFIKIYIQKGFFFFFFFSFWYKFYPDCLNVLWAFLNCKNISNIKSKKL